MINPITKSARSLRVSLIILFLSMIVAMVALSIISLRYLNNYARDVNGVVFQAETGSDRIDAIKLQATALEKQQVAVKRAEQIVSARESYEYQDVAFLDLQAIAAKAGVSITLYTFSDDAAGSNKTVPAKPSTSAATPPPSGFEPGQQKSSSGFKPSYISISLAQPVDYIKFLNFIHYIEQNLTKMQIAEITLSSTASTDDEYQGKNIVSTGLMVVEVYTR